MCACVCVFAHTHTHCTDGVLGCEPRSRGETPGGPEESRWTKSRYTYIYDTFRVSCLNWADDDGSLEYQFGYSSGDIESVLEQISDDGFQPAFRQGHVQGPSAGRVWWVNTVGRGWQCDSWSRDKQCPTAPSRRCYLAEI